MFNAQYSSLKTGYKSIIMIPGEYILSSAPIIINEGRPTVKIIAINTGDRPVQVGSHFHFFEVNKQMNFDREKAFGMRLDIAAGTAVRFEPGEEKEVQLVSFGGNQKVKGFNNLVNSYIGDNSSKEQAMKNLAAADFKNKLL